MKGDHQQIRNTVESLKRVYNFKGPLHFTDFTNLSSVFNLGYLCSREYCQNQNINFADVADQEVIQHTNIDVKNCTRFYYKEKTMTLYRNEGIKEDGSSPHVPVPVYLLFDEELLYLDDTVFANGNAGSRYTSFGGNFDFFNNNMDWNEIFNRNPIYEEDGPEKWEIKRKRQAELLSIQPIPLNYLKNIIFRCNTDYKRACNLFGYNEKFVISPEMFHNIRNYISDYNIEITDLGTNRSLNLNFKVNRPVCNHDKHGYKLFDLNENLLVRVPITYPQGFGTDFNLKIDNVPNTPFKFCLWFYDILSIEEVIR